VSIARAEYNCNLVEYSLSFSFSLAISLSLTNFSHPISSLPYRFVSYHGTGFICSVILVNTSTVELLLMHRVRWKGLHIRVHYTRLSTMIHKQI
ncbi:hypothetical protein DFH11DRAFT_1612316, partial [Phellopilus nigrolimitatus]